MSCMLVWFWWLRTFSCIFRFFAHLFGIIHSSLSLVNSSFPGLSSFYVSSGYSCSYLFGTYNYVYVLSLRASACISPCDLAFLRMLLVVCDAQNNHMRCQWSFSKPTRSFLDFSYFFRNCIRMLSCSHSINWVWFEQKNTFGMIVDFNEFSWLQFCFMIYVCCDLRWSKGSNVWLNRHRVTQR